MSACPRRPFPYASWMRGVAHPELIRPIRKMALLRPGRIIVWVSLLLASFGPAAHAQQRREREPNSVYAERRAKLASQLDGPVILWGFTGREEVSQAYVFSQEDNFYYLTGHNEEGAGLILLPASEEDRRNSANAPLDGPRETFFLPAKDPAKERWNGVRLSPTDPGIEARTGFAVVKPFAEMRADVER